jgi:FAD/FMN-containing dehydrogenase
VLLVIGFEDIYLAADAVPQVLAAGPIACEGLDTGIIGGLRERGLKLEDIALLPAGNAWLMVEFGADPLTLLLNQQEDLKIRFKGNLITDRSLMIASGRSARRAPRPRRSSSSRTTVPDPVVGWEDAAVDPLRLGGYLREFQALVDRYGYRTSLYGHFGDGCIHARINFELRTAQGIAQWRGFLREAAELVVAYGGSLSGEHGDGQGRAEFLPVMYGPELMVAFASSSASGTRRGA